MKNPGCTDNRGSPLYASGSSSYQILPFPNAPAAMILKAKAAFGDDADSLSKTGLCSDFYVFRWVQTANAGVAKFAPFGTITEDFFDSIFDINVKGLLFTVQKALPLLPDGASIILNASIVASKGLPMNSVYSATKAAVRSFARTWTTDLKDRRIRVNAVSPGSIDTPGLSNLLASAEAGEQRKKMISNVTPLGRFGTPDEIAKAVVFLASDDSSYVTGTELFVDGGFAQV